MDRDLDLLTPPPLPEETNRASFSADLEGYLSGVDLGSDGGVMQFPSYPYGCNMSVRRELAERVGGFCVRLGRTGSNLISNEEKHFFYTIQRDNPILVQVRKIGLFMLLWYYAGQLSSAFLGYTGRNISRWAYILRSLGIIS